MDFETWISSTQPTIPLRSALSVLRLSAEGATVPFIARYRKEQTGNLDEVMIQTVLDARERWDQIIKRQTFIVGEIEAQQKLTPELKEKLLSTFQLEVLEDLYLPYKIKKKSKATAAKEAGLQVLADWIWNCGHGTETPQPGQTLELWAFTFRNEEKGVGDAAAAIQGALDILIERLSEMQELRHTVRQLLFEKGHLKTQKGEKVKPNSKFENYFSYSEAIQSLLKPQNSHRYLAIRRGWMEEELTLSLGNGPKDEPFEPFLDQLFLNAACTVTDSPGADVLKRAANLALKAHVLPSIENEAHRALKDVGDEIAIKVFSENVRKLLLASPFGPKTVLGVDPGIRTGCKLALVDESGKFTTHGLLRLQTEEEKTQAKQTILAAASQVQLKAIAVGNGTAGRETESFIRSVIKENNLSIPVVMVSESGASVYSASEAAREEFPDLDLTIRGAISIARRLQDPLAELVKIDPKSIGVGQYQHDVPQKSLKKSLEFVVDSCVNTVGVNLNTASYHLLAHVSGIGPVLAKAIVEHRAAKGLFRSRLQLLEVTRFSAKAFEQSAGFLRIPDGDNPLDNTGVHPERYPILESLAKKLSRTVANLLGAGVAEIKKDEQFKQEVGNFTFDDIIRELEKPGRDPRDLFVAFQYRDDIHDLKDLKPGMECPGIVTNVTNFGAFVDIGVHQDGLVHISQLSDRFVKDAREVVSPGDRVKVRVLDIALEKKQIALTMKTPMEARRPEPRQQTERERVQRPQGNRPQPPNKQPRKPPKSKFTHNPFAALAVLKTGKK
jgi:protein Tex